MTCIHSNWSVSRLAQIRGVWSVSRATTLLKTASVCVFVRFTSRSCSFSGDSPLQLPLYEGVTSNARVLTRLTQGPDFTHLQPLAPLTRTLISFIPDVLLTLPVTPPANRELHKKFWETFTAVNQILNLLLPLGYNDPQGVRFRTKEVKMKWPRRCEWAWEDV